MKRFRGMSALLVLLLVRRRRPVEAAPARPRSKRQHRVVVATASTPKQGGTVTISNEQGQTWTCQFNPFNPAVNLESLGFVYEPLVFVNVLSNQAETPMLATSYSGAPDKKSIVFTIRDGREVERRPAVHAPTTSRSPST